MQLRSKRSPRPPAKDGNPLAAALALLARRPYSLGEMRRALARKFPGSPLLGSAIARLRELGYLDDRKAAEQLAASLARNRSFGRQRIRRELKRKWFDYRAIEPALDRAFEDTSEPELLEKALEKKLRSARLPLTPRKLQSLVASLLRRGFRAGDIIKAVRARPELRLVSENVDPADMEEAPEEKC